MITRKEYSYNRILAQILSLILVFALAQPAVTSTVYGEEEAEGGSVQLGGVLQFKSAVDASEGESYARVTVLRTVGSIGTISVDYKTIPGSAVPSEDYGHVSGTLVFGDHEMSKTIDIPIIDDSIEDDYEDLVIELSNPTGGAILGSLKRMTIWIKDNDENTSSGVFEWATDTLVIEESSPLETLEILRKDGTYGESSIDVAMYSGTATAGDDFKSLATTVDFGPGWDMKRIYWELAIDDFIHEGDEVFTVVLSNPQGGATLGAKHTMTVTILDDDPDAAGTFSILGTPAVSEGGGVAQVQVHRSGGTSGQVTVDFATSDGTAVSGSDYEAIAGTLTFESGEYRRTISIPINDDSLIEGAESFRVSISNPTGGASIGTAFSTDVTIQDNDFTPGKLTFDTADYRLVEESGAVRLKVLRQGGTKGVVTVNYSAISKTAAAGSDFIVAAGTLTFHEGEIFKHIDVQIVDDAIPEFNETFQVKLSNPTGNASLGTFPTRTITIFDTDHLH